MNRSLQNPPSWIAGGGVASTAAVVASHAAVRPFGPAAPNAFPCAAQRADTPSQAPAHSAGQPPPASAAAAQAASVSVAAASAPQLAAVSRSATVTVRTAQTPSQYSYQPAAGGAAAAEET